MERFSDNAARRESVVGALKPGWVRYVHEESGVPYYAHEVTGESTWDAPYVSLMPTS